MNDVITGPTLRVRLLRFLRGNTWPRVFVSHSLASILKTFIILLKLAICSTNKNILQFVQKKAPAMGGGSQDTKMAA
jgi:hypothetical protein